MVAQCGGQGNVERFHARLREVADRPPFATHLAGWTGPWNFASVEDTVERLAGAGFVDVEVWREPHPVVPEYTEDYLRTVCLGHHIERLPSELRELFVSAVAERCGQPLELDYMRLNVSARRPARNACGTERGVR